MLGQRFDAVEKGMVNLERHIENVQKFGVPVVVAVNQFPFDTDAEMQAVQDACAKLGVTAVRSNHHGHDIGSLCRTRECVLQCLSS